ncbi:efflux RND transporter periplasmic adaptor subunit [Poseidonocella sedimentorum]|uniref:RND family efflux transporter, MFP subunit n=1 Tax=Poseidonocella sedimentorum TaxID=871652 RepID=A0A1I6ECV2_9RHOB|nr:efflux RND transporter periplasmic adaptor subunit [Poseidonocella sedimentorum]SFR15467.1 RND family efflux transporter, MFP subunit [Poseidonocella sedimentorum]
MRTRAAALAALSLGIAGAVSAQQDYGRVGLESLGSSFRGIVECNAALDLAFATGGIVAEIPVAEGETVDAGTVLIRLDQRIEEIETERRRALWEDMSEAASVESQILLAEEQVAAAERIFEQSRGISLEELQNRRLTLELLLAKRTQLANAKIIQELDYQTARAALARRTLAAPAPGTVAEILRDPGESVQASDTVLRLCDTSRLFATINLPARRATRLHEGETLTLDTEDRGRISARVAFLSPVIDPASGLQRVRLELLSPPAGLKPGATLALELDTE